MQLQHAEVYERENYEVEWWDGRRGPKVRSDAG